MFDKLNILLAALLQQYVATVRLPMFFSLRRIYSYQNMVTPSPDVAAVPLTTDWFLYCSDIGPYRRNAASTCTVKLF